LDPDVAALVRDLRDALDAPDYEAAYAWGCALGGEDALAAIETRLRRGQARSDVSGGVSPT
jgi:hypothetical protein